MGAGAKRSIVPVHIYLKELSLSTVLALFLRRECIFVVAQFSGVLELTPVVPVD